MTKINLLPWREHARQARKMNFVYLLISAVILAIIFIIITHIYYRALINTQESRNTFLQSQINQEQKVLNDLMKQKKEQTRINSELHFIFGLREKSYQSVRLLDELTRVVPEGISFHAIEKKNNEITLTGKAQSDLEITLFMKNITRSKVFKQPQLEDIVAKQSPQGEERTFEFKVMQQEPQ